MYTEYLKRDDVSLFKISSLAALLLLSLALTPAFSGKVVLAKIANQKDAASTPHFLTYQNITAGFKIQYPSYFQTFENTTGNDSSAVYFVEPLSGVRASVATFKIPQINLQNEPKPLILSTYLNGFTEPFQPYNNTQSSLTTIAGTTANKTILDYFSNGHPARIMILSSLIGNKVYVLSYAATKGNYALFFPTAQQMINSFSILPNVTNTSAASSNTSTNSSNATASSLSH